MNRILLVEFQTTKKAAGTRFIRVNPSHIQYLEMKGPETTIIWFDGPNARHEEVVGSIEEVTDRLDADYSGYQPDDGYDLFESRRERIEHAMLRPLSMLGVDAGLRGQLERLGIKYIGDVAVYTVDELKNSGVPMFNDQLTDIVKGLRRLGLQLGANKEHWYMIREFGG